ncbi:myeloid differentiation primary response protein MyD88-A-like isoform X2 [Haliotis rubra]|nr:myeloid differentiation primary response protein MyD88-A-like isoform X1 [Haliotis rubra]XP_046565846.1 myeloid differentiation primary response protein MyD88-A-like isoform X2 [Haliotis rubra]
MTTRLSDLPYVVTGRVCDYLNIPSALGKDWRYLAGMLGKTSHDVELITFRCPRDPCGALLNDWISTHPRSTVADLVIKLKDMERLDVISVLGVDWENM